MPCIADPRNAVLRCSGASSVQLHLVATALADDLPCHADPHNAVLHCSRACALQLHHGAHLHLKDQDLEALVEG